WWTGSSTMPTCCHSPEKAIDSVTHYRNHVKWTQQGGNPLHFSLHFYVLSCCETQPRSYICIIFPIQGILMPSKIKNHIRQKVDMIFHIPCRNRESHYWTLQKQDRRDFSF